jgi:hypothetical protein
MDSKRDKYHRNAEECRQEAARTPNRRDRRGWIKLADFWSKMARKATPDPRQPEMTDRPAH